jgi:hypothetical protein
MPVPEQHVPALLDDYVHGLLEPEVALQVERHCAGCPSCGLALEEARKRLAALESLPACEASEPLIQQTLGRIESYEQRRRRLRRWLTWGPLSTVAAAAVVIASVHAYYWNLKPSPYDIRLLGQSQLLPGTAGALRVRLSNAVTQTALAGVPVTLDLVGAGGQVVRLASFQTNAQGIGEPRFQLPDWEDGSYELRVTAHPDGKREEFTRSIRLRRSWKLMLSSDKPVYQPGQEILLRSLALRRPDLKPVAGHDALFTITDPKGNLIFKQQEPTSKFGICSARCPLATEVNEGPYTIACKVGDTESKLTVEVNKYVLPKFKIGVELEKPYYQPGQTVRGTVQADYFFGKPVADGRVEIAVRTPEVPGRPGTEVTSVRAQTNAAGKATFEFNIPRSLVGRPQDGGDARIMLEVTVTDTAGQKQSRTVSRVVTNRPVRVEAIPEDGTLVKGVANTIYLFASYADGRPVKHASLEITGVGKLTANDLGLASFTFRPQFTESTSSVGIRDDANRTHWQQITLARGPSGPDFLVRTDKAVYDGGATVHLTALGGGSEPVFFDLIKDGQTLLTDTVAMTNGRGQYDLDLPPELFGTIELCTYRFDSEGVPVRKTRALFIRQASQLKIGATLDRDEYRPGRTAKLRLILTDANGKPAPGAISLAAVDEAVFSVLEQAPGSEKLFYTLEQKLLEPIYAIYPWSPDAPLPAAEREEFEKALFARTVQSTPGWSNGEAPQASARRRMEGAPPRPGGQAPSSPHTLAVSSWVIDAAKVKQTRERALEDIAWAWGFLVIACVVLADIGIWMSVRPLWSVAVGHAVFVPLVLCLGVVSLLGTNAHGTFSFMAAKDSAAQSAAGSRPPQEKDTSDQMRVRQDFPETLLWRPELITDDKGEFRLDIPLADSITTWRLTASAVTADGHLGAAQSSIRVFQPFFVDLNLPVSLTRGDEVAVPAVVYNYLDRPQTVRLTFEDATWFESLGPPTQTLELAAHEVRSTAFRIRARKAGSHALQVTANGAGVDDAIKRDIEVVPDGRRIEQVVTDRLTGDVSRTIVIPPDCVPDSQKIIVKLYPGVFSQVIEGMEGMLRMPFG